MQKWHDFMFIFESQSLLQRSIARRRRHLRPATCKSSPARRARSKRSALLRRSASDPVAAPAEFQLPGASNAGKSSPHNTLKERKNFWPHNATIAV